jgi:flagellar biosynthetic protein FliR
MLDLQITDYPTLIAFWLVFSRFLAVIIQLPLFEDMPVPMTLKTLMGVILSYAFFPYVQGEVLKDVAYLGVENFWYLTIFYTVTGLVIGYLVKSIMSIFTSAGTLITQQVGFAAVSYFDPSSAERVGPFEKLIQWTLLILVVSSGALYPMFKGIFGSFFSMNLQDLGQMANVTPYFLNLFKSIFVSSIMLATPLIFTNMLIMVVLGIIARTVPQMNVLMVSFVVNIGMGLLVFAATSDEFFEVAFKLYTEKLADWFNFVT